MRLLVERTIELLKMQVKENLKLINQNQVKIMEMLKQPASEEEKHIFEACYAENKRLLIENNDFINLQLVLIDFLEKHKSSSALVDEISESYSQLPDDANVIFDMTIGEELPFDNLHPLFEDDKFFKKLIRYYTSIEAYEKCSELHKARNQYMSAR